MLFICRCLARLLALFGVGYVVFRLSVLGMTKGRARVENSSAARRRLQGVEIDAAGVADPEANRQHARRRRILIKERSIAEQLHTACSKFLTLAGVVREPCRMPHEL